MNFIKKHSKLWIILMSVMLLFTVVFIVANVILPNYAGNINAALDIQTYRIEKAGDVDPGELIYKKSAYYTGTKETKDEKIVQTVDEARLAADEQALCAEIEEEGAVLLKNENGALPLKNGAKVTLFSQSSARLVYGGTGSGAVKADPNINLKTALETGGKVTVNPTIWDWYTKGGGSTYERYLPSLQHDSVNYKINEAPWNQVRGSGNNGSSFATYGDAAIFVLGRSGGEESDLPRSGAPDSKNGDYLILNETEEQILEELAVEKAAGTFKSIIVILNTSNMVQLDFVDNALYSIDACLWIGSVGMTGINGVGRVLRGEVNPSGRTIETYYNDNRANPVLANFGKTQWNNGVAGLDSGNNNHADIYVAYQEGIYVGYRYFETRYEDYVMNTHNTGTFIYKDAVKYPFGSGLSYGDFSYESFNVEEKDDIFEVTVGVKNNGTLMAGKHTVMIYSQSEYTDYDYSKGIEKSAVNLIGFEKSGLIGVGQTASVVVKVEKNDLRTYDARGYGTYIYDAGDYYLTVGKDAHDAANNILAKKGYTTAAGRMDAAGNVNLVHTWNKAETDASIFSKSKWTDSKIENQFDNADLNVYSGRGSNSITYMSRNNWEGTIPTSVLKVDVTDQMKLDGLVLSDAQKAAHRKEYMDDERNVDKDGNKLTENTKMPTLGYEPDVDAGEEKFNVVMLKDEPLGSDKWDKLMDMVSFKEMVNIIGDGFHHTREIGSIGLPGTKNENGPQGLTASLVGGHSSMAYTSSDVRAATYNRELVKRVGEFMGEDCLAADYCGMYAPGANIHRSNYQGRSFEYYSEDPFVSSHIGRGEVTGITSKGVFTFMKHFALNEQESGRFGIATFANEQTIREIYLTAFEGSLGNMQLGSVMSSYNRIGVVWTGAHRGLMVDVLRYEWNSGSANITDCCTAGARYAEGNIGIFGGTTFWDGYSGSYENVWDETDPITVHAMKAATKLMAQTIARSSGINGISTEDVIVPVMPWWQVLTITFNIVFGVLAFAFAALLVMTIVLKRKQA